MDDPTRELRIDQVIADYLEAEARGEPPAEEAWLADHPDLAGELREFLADHAAARRATAGLFDLLEPGSGGPAPHEGAVELGDYQLLEEIGRGGMGVIHRALQRGLNRIVAVKTIRAGRLAGPEEVRRFRREAESAARLDHPNIVTVYEVGEREGQHFFSMALVEGQSLAELIRERPLAVEDAARLVASVAGAVGYAHRAGVLHRDLKPSNILLDRDGTPKVTDFGLAKLIADDSELTSTGAVLGTPAFMAPEQAAGRRGEVGEAADVYSLGAVLYACLTTRPPFVGQTPAETLVQVRSGELTPPRLLNNEVPAELEAICLQCLARDPARRYPSAQELAEDLQRFVAGQPVLARSPGPLERAWRWCRRHAPGTRLKSAAASAGLFLGLGVFLGLLLGPRVGLLQLSASEPRYNAVAAVAALMAIWWLTEAIPLAATALIPLVLFPALKIMPAQQVAGHYADDIIFLFLGGFLIAIAVEDSGLPRRLALRIVAALGDDPRRIVLSFMLTAGLLSMWISNSAVTIMLLPIATGLLEQLERDGGDTRQLGGALMLGIAYAASIAGTATPVGSPVNVSAIAQSGALGLSFARWMSLGLPFTATLLGVAWLLLTRRLFALGGEASPGARAVARGGLGKLGPMKPAEWRALGVFAATAALWITRAPGGGWGWAPALFTGPFAPGQTTTAPVTDGTVAVVMALLCFLVPAGGEQRRPLLRWSSTVRLPWGVLFLFGGGLALSAGMKEVGLLGHLGGLLARLLAGVSLGPLVTVVAVTVLLAALALHADRRVHGALAWRRAAIPYSVVAAALALLLLSGGEAGPLLLTFSGMTLLTEIFTNLTTVQLLTGPLVEAAPAGLAGPLVIGSTLAASCAFILPISTTPNAVVFSSGRVSVREMARAGSWLNVVGVLILTALVVLHMYAWA